MKYGAEAIFKTKSQSGFLINVASVAGLMPQSGQAHYTATKFGVIGMTRVAAMAFFEKDCPAGRMGDPRECAYLALFLASDMAHYITGAAIPVRQWTA